MANDRRGEPVTSSTGANIVIYCPWHPSEPAVSFGATLDGDEKWCEHEASR